MTNKKNNAIEKVENVIRERKKQKNGRTLREERKKEHREAEENKRPKTRKEKNLTVAFLTFLAVSLVLASVMIVNSVMIKGQTVALETAYRKNFFDTVDQVNNIDVNLSKVLASEDSGAIANYLTDTAINSELAENDIQNLPLKDESKFYTAKLINQIGDFSKYLYKKLYNGENLTNTDRENLTKLYNLNLKLKNMLIEVTDSIDNEYEFIKMLDNNANDLILSNFSDMQNLSVEYPELIYDGPFSDGKEDREIKGLTGEEISYQDAVRIFVSAFDDKNIEEVVNEGETNGEIACYNLSAQVDGENIYVQITKKGGKIILFASSGDCKEVNYELDYAESKAVEFCEKLGIFNLKPVWVNLANNVFTVNLAYTENDVIVYSDLVKVRVCADSGNVLGLEGLSYYVNHTERVIKSPKLSKEECKNKVSKSIEIENGRLVIVPIGENSEKLCYEFYGKMNDSTFYVYIDADTGRQVEMFKVVESTEGMYLI